MNKVYLCFHFIKQDLFIEVLFDSRLSFKDNFEMLFKIVHIEANYNDITIVDQKRKTALKMDVPIKEYEFRNGQYLDIF